MSTRLRFYKLPILSCDIHISNDKFNLIISCWHRRVRRWVIWAVKYDIELWCEKRKCEFEHLLFLIKSNSLQTKIQTWNLFDSIQTHFHRELNQSFVNVIFNFFHMKIHNNLPNRFWQLLLATNSSPVTWLTLWTDRLWLWLPHWMS